MSLIFFLNRSFAYYRSLPMPITSLKFGSIDPISGKETDDDNEQFVSRVCWRRKSDMAIAANSSGRIKMLEMVWTRKEVKEHFLGFCFWREFCFCLISGSDFCP